MMDDWQSTMHGMDIVEIARIKAILGRSPSFEEKAFSLEERAYCRSKAAPEIHFATRYAAKAAVMKALGTSFFEGVRPNTITIHRTNKGRAYALLAGRARERARELGIVEIPVSLSYTHTDAVACAMALTEKSAPKPPAEDPMEELARSFKELRGMLDDIDARPEEKASPVAEGGEGTGGRA